jgi:hypothetical protein
MQGGQVVCNKIGPPEHSHLSIQATLPARSPIRTHAGLSCQRQEGTNVAPIGPGPTPCEN